MPFFKSKDSYLGIDFDSSSIKVVELKNESGRPRLITYGYYDRTLTQGDRSDTAGNISEASHLIKQVCAKAKVTSKKVITAMPAFSVFSSILTLPSMSKKDMASAVKWEAKKVIPMPIDEMILDWKLLENFDDASMVDQPPIPGGTGNGKDVQHGLRVERRKFLKISQESKGQYLKVLLTAAPKDLVKRYVDTFKSAGLTLLSLDTEAFALIRSLVGNDKSALMLVDIGSVVTNISVIVNGIPVFSRSMDIGGSTITQAIANSLNITLERAEQFKYDIGMNPERVGQGSVPKTIEDTLTPIVDELKYSLNLYRSQGKHTIEKLILTGGSSLLLNLPNYLGNILSLKVYLGDPWARVIYPEELKPVLDEIGARFSVAIGLAMRNIE